MINKKNQQMIKKIIKNENGMCLSGMFRKLPLSKDQIRISVSFLLGSREIEEEIYGMSKVYYFVGDEE